jgi:hypothetical protein
MRSIAQSIPKLNVWRGEFTANGNETGRVKHFSSSLLFSNLG